MQIECRVIHGAVIRVYDDAGNVIETHEHAGGPGSKNIFTTQK